MATHANDGLARLAPLHDLKDFKVANNNLDVRGWEVIGADGKRIGKVDDLIVDRELMKVRYLDVDVDKDRLMPDTDLRHLLLPIGAAQLDDDSDQVFVSMDQSALARFPLYSGGAVDADYEYRVMHAITTPQETYTQHNAAQHKSSHTSSSPNADFYTHDNFNEDNFYGKRHQRHGNQQLHSDQMNSGSLHQQHQAPLHQNTQYPSDQHQTSSHHQTPQFQSDQQSFKSPAADGRPVQDDIATIERLRQMLEQGTITQEEFTALKRKAIGF